MSLIDSHCHLDKYVRAGELDTVLERAQNAEVTQMITVGTDLDDWSLYRDLATAHAGRIFYTVGLHPCSVDNTWQTALERLPTFFKETTRPVALGEIGLDYFHLPKDKALATALVAYQKEAFTKQLEIAASLDMPVVVHSRHAFKDCLQCIHDSDVSWNRVVFHCFGDGAKEVAELNALGGRASFTGIATYKNAQSTRDALLKQGIEPLMIETDAPYLTPVPHRGKRNEPAFMRHTAEYCAQVMGIDWDSFCKRTTENTIDFFNL